MAAVLHLLYALTELRLAIWGVHLYRQSSNIRTILLLAVLAGLIYDNLTISIGSLIGEGDLLRSLNLLRFLFHLFAPLIVVVAIELAQKAGIAWAGSLIIRRGAWAIALGLILIGFFTHFLELKLIPATFAGTLRYKDAELYRLPIPVFLTIVLLAIVGSSIWRKLNWSWVFVGALSAFFGGAVPTQIAGAVVGSGAEVILSLCLLATEQRLQKLSQPNSGKY